MSDYQSYSGSSKVAATFYDGNEGRKPNMSFPAAYSGKCGCCDEYFKARTEVTFTEFDGLIVASHLHEKKPQPVCPKCFIEVPKTGVCDSCGWTVAGNTGAGGPALPVG